MGSTGMESVTSGADPVGGVGKGSGLTGVDSAASSSGSFRGGPVGAVVVGAEDAASVGAVGEGAVPTGEVSVMARARSVVDAGSVGVGLAASGAVVVGVGDTGSVGGIGVGSSPAGAADAGSVGAVGSRWAFVPVSSRAGLDRAALGRTGAGSAPGSATAGAERVSSRSCTDETGGTLPAACDGA